MGSVRASVAAGAGGPGAAVVGEVATERLVEVAQRAADAAGEVLRKYFRQRVEIIDKEDHSACLAFLYY
jgi:inositol-phosphate phosphatase/L-galactose 1-phosphate phosphatase/histidinol-phosphatase